MNTRHIRTTKAWFGGGADLNPIVPDDDDTGGLPCGAAQAPATPSAPTPMTASSAGPTSISIIPHRGEARGVGGIFYDYVEGDHEAGFAFTRGVGEAFLDVYPRIVARHMDRPWTTRSAPTSCFAAAATSSSIFFTIEGPNSA